ncbi:hypothetical protein ACLOJK_029535 [Asimina triloba]
MNALILLLTRPTTPQHRLAQKMLALYPSQRRWTTEVEKLEIGKTRRESRDAVECQARKFRMQLPQAGKDRSPFPDGTTYVALKFPRLSRNYYMGIWFKQVPEQTVVWVANRETPLPDASSQLKISEQDGNLVLINRTNVPAWSSNSTTKISNRTMAVLLDSGNLVLRDSSNSSIVIWQSFDYPTSSRFVESSGTVQRFKDRYRDLRIITHDFSEKLGGGSFGSVFTGTLPDTSLVAVKKLEGLGQGEKEFRSEVSTIGMIQHVNLVRLLGFCYDGSKRLLVYEFMPNGSLDSYLFGQNSRALDWKTRYQIVLEIAKGLAYLHEKCGECIVHCDIKPANILLDAAFCPKIADFGMAKLIGRDFSRVLTTMRGTVGYLAPEWIQGVAISAKADVYSYGMMTLEIVPGRRNTRTSAIADGCYFPLWAAGRIKEDDAICLLDPRLEGNADIEEVNRVCRVAIWCIQDTEESRPSMGELANILEGGFEVNLPPIPGFLQMLLDNQDMVKSDT